MAKAAAKKRDEKSELIEKISKALGVSAAEAELRALREMVKELGLDEPQAAPAKARASQTPSLPQRLYLLLDGRGLDGRGMPMEVIDLPCTIGSDKRSTIWINSPQIETHHLQITHGDEGWVLEDLASEHGTFLGDKRIKRRVIKDGDDYRLAGYLRLRTELR
jgi:hypothetical protein